MRRQPGFRWSALRKVSPFLVSVFRALPPCVFDVVSHHSATLLDVVFDPSAQSGDTSSTDLPGTHAMSTTAAKRRSPAASRPSAASKKAANRKVRWTQQVRVCVCGEGCRPPPRLCGVPRCVPLRCAAVGDGARREGGEHKRPHVPWRRHRFALRSGVRVRTRAFSPPLSLCLPLCVFILPPLALPHTVWLTSHRCRVRIGPHGQGAACGSSVGCGQQGGNVAAPARATDGDCGRSRRRSDVLTPRADAQCTCGVFVCGCGDIQHRPRPKWPLLAPRRPVRTERFLHVSAPCRYFPGFSRHFFSCSGAAAYISSRLAATRRLCTH